jgi:hypothetical protein
MNRESQDSVNLIKCGSLFNRQLRPTSFEMFFLLRALNWSMKLSEHNELLELEKLFETLKLSRLLKL